MDANRFVHHDVEKIDMLDGMGYRLTLNFLYHDRLALRFTIQVELDQGSGAVRGDELAQLVTVHLNRLGRSAFPVQITWNQALSPKYLDRFTSQLTVFYREGCALRHLWPLSACDMVPFLV
jgi:hypothetical protein